MRRKNVLKDLKNMEDLEYKKFHKKLVPNLEEDKLIGIRVPNLRKYAKSLKNDNPQNWIDEIFAVDKNELMYEERVLVSYLIGYMDSTLSQWKSNMEQFVEIIDNWAVCDTISSTMKIVKQNREEVWDFLQSFLNDNREYHIRFGVVMIIEYFIDSEYIDRVLMVLNRVLVEDYYAMMGVAWAISMCFVKCQSETTELLKSESLDITTHNKAIQKIRESNRVSRMTKDVLLELKR